MRFIGKERESAAYELISDSWCNSLRTGASTNIEVLSAALAPPGEAIAEGADIDSVFTVFEVDPNAGQDDVGTRRCHRSFQIDGSSLGGRRSPP